MKQSDQSPYSLHASQNQAANFVKMCSRRHFPLHFLLEFSALTFCMLCYFAILFCRLPIFFKINFSTNYFGNAIRASNGLDSEQNQCSVGPDLGPNCLQRLSADDISRR